MITAMRGLLRKIATWLLVAVVGGMATAVLGEWFIEVARDKGWYSNAGSNFDRAIFFASEFLTSSWISWPILLLAGFVIGLWTDTLLAKFKVEERTKTVEPKVASAFVPNPKKAEFIAELYPLMQTFSETYVDQFGNRIGDWREAFENGLSEDWFVMVNAEQRHLADQFDKFRGMFASHGFYDDIYAMDDGIAQRINAIGIAIAPVRQIAQRVSYKFDAKSVELAEEPMNVVLATVGQLRLYLTQECLKRLATLHQNALGKISDQDVVQRQQDATYLR